MARASAAGSPASTASSAGGVAGEVDVARRDQLVDHPGQAEPLAVLGEKIVTPRSCSSGDLLRHDDAAAAAEDLDVAGADLGAAAPSR